MKKFLLVLFIVGSLVFMACDINDTVYGYSTYKYEVAGSAQSVRITINDENGNTVQHTVEVPWSMSFQKDNMYSYWAYLSAQNQGKEGTVIVRIYRNDKLQKEATSSGAYCIASVNYSM